MKYLYNFNGIRKDAFQCIDKAGNKYSFTLKEFLSENIMKLNVDNKKYLIYPIIRPEWLYSEPEHIDKFCISKHEFDKQNMKLQLADLPIERYYLSKSWGSVIWSGKYDYYSSIDARRDNPFFTMNSMCVWLRFLVIELKGDCYTYDIGELNYAWGMNCIIFNGFRLNSFTNSVELLDDNKGQSGVVFDTDKWYLLHSVPKCDNTVKGSSENIIFKTSLEDLFSAYYTYEDTFSTGRKRNKSISFGMPYGISSLSIQNLLGVQYVIFE